MRFYVDSEELNSFCVVLKIYLLGMKFQKKPRLKKFRDFRNNASQIIFILMDEHKIIHISSIVPNLQFFFNERIEFVKIEVRKYLTREISDGNPCSGSAIKKTLRFWKSDPIGSLAFDCTVFRNIPTNKCFDEETI